MRRGMTLIEILIVVTVIAVLVGLLVPAVTAVQRQSQQVKAVRQLEDFAAAILVRLQDRGDLPSDFDSRPAYYMVEEPISQGKPADMELTKTQRKGDLILGWNLVPLVVHIERGTSYGKPYVAKITIANQGEKVSGGLTAVAILNDAATNKDDVVFVYDGAKASRFTRVTR